MISILFTGYMLLWLYPPSDSHNAAVLRLTEMIAYPLLLALPYRFIIPGFTRTELEENRSKANRSLQSSMLELNAIYKLYLHTSLEKYCEELVRTIATIMEADICLCLLSDTGNNQLKVPAGYNLKKVTRIEGFNLDNLKSPILANMMKLGKPVKIPASSSPPDLVWLARMIGESGVGSLMAVTANDPQGNTLLGIVLLTPYSKKDWGFEDHKTLTELAMAISPHLGKINQISQLQSELTMQIEKNQSLQKQSELDRAELEVLRRELSEKVKAPSIDIENYEREIRLALVEVAQLRATLADYDQHVIERRLLDEDQMKSGKTMHELGSVVQELRQPLSSTIGYTDLLLGESIGILGALQRKFLERIKTSTVRIGNLVDELERITVVDKFDEELAQETINLNALIDDVLAGMMEKYSKKDISLRVDIPEHLPLIHADSDAIQQIIIHLLNHAGSVTENNGVVSFNVGLEVTDQKPNYVLVQVKGGNGTKSSENGAQVLSEVKRGEDSVPQGFGERSVGLSIVKTLVDAQGGRTWVESEPEKGTTYSVLLPINHEG
jgi:signal transduction histidine kinase